MYVFLFLLAFFYHLSICNLSILSPTRKRTSTNSDVRDSAYSLSLRIPSENSIQASRLGVFSFSSSPAEFPPGTSVCHGVLGSACPFGPDLFKVCSVGESALIIPSVKS